MNNDGSATSESTMASMGTHTRNLRHAAPGEKPRTHHWPLLLIAAPAAVAIWSGWVGLGGMSGFGIVRPLPGIADTVRINTAITLPIGVEAYGAYALWVWLSGQGSDRTLTFARRSAVGALALGCLGQVVFHLLAAAHWTTAPWPVVVAVACMPVVTLSFAAALVHLTRADAEAAGEAEAEAGGEAAPVALAEAVTEAIEKPAAEAMPEPVPVAPPVAAEEPDPVPSETPASVPQREPEAKPVKEPRARSGRPSEDLEAKRARAEYRKSVTQGQPLSDRALGAKYGRSRTWGGNRIAEVEDGPALTAQAR
jgi:hypothetical protein